MVPSDELVIVTVAADTGPLRPSRSETLKSVVNPPITVGSSLASMSAVTFKVDEPVPGLFRDTAGGNPPPVVRSSGPDASHRWSRHREVRRTVGRGPGMAVSVSLSSVIFQTVLVVVLERLEGVLDVVCHDALVRLAVVGRGRIDERGLRLVQEPARDVDAQGDVEALPVLDGDGRDQARLLALVDLGREREVAERAGLDVGAGDADRDIREIGVRRDERRVVSRAGLVDLELEPVVGAR